MSLKDIILGGASIAFPALAPAIGIVNRFIGGPEKLPPSATPEQVAAAYDALPENDRAAVDRAVEVELAYLREGSARLETMASVESAAENTRPRIALLMARVVALGVTGSVGALLFGSVTGDAGLVAAVGDSWPMLATMIGIPAGVVTSYFGQLNRDKQCRRAAAAGQPITQPPGILGALFGGRK